MNSPLNEWETSKAAREALEELEQRNAVTQRWLMVIIMVVAVTAAVVAVAAWMH